MYLDLSITTCAGEGGRSRTVIWDDPSDDITGAIARSYKVAGTFQKV